MMILALAGGVGGARLASGLAECSAPGTLMLVVNTGDDFVHYGLHISPDLDSVMYALADRNDEERGWGLRGETWRCMQALEKLGADAWFRLGDQDIATHLLRTTLLSDGASLTEATRALCQGFGLAHTIMPMSDQAVPTRIRTDEGLLDFQDYFVRRQCSPRILGMDYGAAACAQPSVAFQHGLQAPDLEAIVFCPSNPYLSIGPILELAGVRDGLRTRRVPAVAVSPIIGGSAVKGPLAKIITEQGMKVGPATIARYYAGLIDGLVIDLQDAACRSEIEDLGIRVCVAQTMMTDRQSRAALARQTVNFATGLN